jgi:hypothetical protein
MNVTFACPKCAASSRVEVPSDATALVCPQCAVELKIPPGTLADGGVSRCLACPSTDLFVRKDFPQRLGVAIVVLGFAASCVTWHYYYLYATFGILFATALIDVALYAVMGDSLNCYRCGAQYRALDSLQKHGPFDLATHERYRQQAARLADGQSVRKTSGAGR